MRMFLISLIICLTPLIKSNAQTDSSIIKNRVYQLGNEMGEAFHKKDYNRFLDLTHPKIVDMSGGRDKMIAIFEKGIGEEFEFVKIEIKKPDLVIIDGALMQCSLEQRQEMKIHGEYYYTIGYIIGISYNYGKTWHFIGVANNTLDKLRLYFPELSSELKVHAQTNPIMIRN